MTKTFKTELAGIGIKAVDLHLAETARRIALDSLRQAYATYCTKKGWGFIERTSPEWAEMQAANTKQYQALKDAKAKEYNARRRLRTACKPFVGAA
ncbi:MAG: hypothetical protein EOP74_00170 [Variovorax sp.]|nr:MAG: hypothetical protein EOP74_00170 [Variovorax sp.]